MRNARPARERAAKPRSDDATDVTSDSLRVTDLLPLFVIARTPDLIRGTRQSRLDWLTFGRLRLAALAMTQRVELGALPQISGHGIGAVADRVHRLLQPLAADPELAGPIFDFIVL